MVRATLSTILIFVLTALAIPAPSPQVPDPAQATRAGNGAGEQFIGGQCLSTADCAAGTACCATLRRPGLDDIGVCSGLKADKQAGKIGCGFGDGVPPPPPSPSPSPSPSPTTTTIINGIGGSGGAATPTGTGTVGGNGGIGGTQFITGPCSSDAECASGCCSPVSVSDNVRGTCAARAVALEAGGKGCNLGRL